MSMAGEHGSRTRYNGGCRCDLCKQASRDYDKIRRQRMLASKHSPGTVTRLPSQQVERPIDEMGPVKAGVMAQISALSTAANRPGLVAIAHKLADDLDNPLTVAQHASISKQLRETMADLGKGSDSKTGKLAAVRQMTRKHEATG
jgi:hypothetical protein